MNEQKQIIDENTIVVCPWCLNITEFSPSEEVQLCQVCRREFNEEDIRDEELEED